jgi:hypothetical protein
MVFENGVKNIQAAAYNGARTVYFIFKTVAYNQDVLIIRKLLLWVCLKTRRATKRDALVLATLR